MCESDDDGDCDAVDLESGRDDDDDDDNDGRDPYVITDGSGESSPMMMGGGPKFVATRIASSSADRTSFVSSSPAGRNSTHVDRHQD